MKYLTYTNFGCVQICHNMILSLIKCGINKSDIFVECFDKKSLEYFTDIACVRNTYTLDDSLSEYKNWSFDPTSDFSKIVSWKWKLLRRFWMEQKQFVFCDSDIVFLSNPEEDLNSYKKDFCIQCDVPGSLYCTGFMFFQNNETCNKITRSCANNHIDDQISLNNLMLNKEFSDNTQLLPIEKYPNGHHYYKNPNFNKSQCIIIHNNHMIGIEQKIAKFKESGYWYANS